MLQNESPWTKPVQRERNMIGFEFVTMFGL